MHPKGAINVSGEEIDDEMEFSMNSSVANENAYLTREFTNYEKVGDIHFDLKLTFGNSFQSQAMAVVAAGALITNIPIVTLINVCIWHQNKNSLFSSGMDLGICSRLSAFLAHLPLP